jgi:hypothetical protein
MECARNERYNDYDLEKKKDRVKKILLRLSKMDDDFLVVAKQEFYDFSYDQIREYLRKENVYINPDLVINIFAKYYKCNILLFQMNKKYPEGEVVVPRNSIANLSYKPNPNYKTVIIIKHGNQSEWPYQCELIIKYLEKDKLIEYIFDNDDLFIKTLNKILGEARKVYTVTPNKNNVEYIPTIEFISKNIS